MKRRQKRSDELSRWLAQLPDGLDYTAFSDAFARLVRGKLSFLKDLPEAQQVEWLMKAWRAYEKGKG